MVEIYYGDGKGKTTAAVGLIIRAAGHKIPVRMVQFLKDGSSGEICVLKSVDGVSVDVPSCFFGFVSNMTDEEKLLVREDYKRLLQGLEEWLDSVLCKSDGDGILAVAVLDEVLHACNYGLIDEDRLLSFIDKYRSRTELVLTGRNPSPALMEAADYLSEVHKNKHPYDSGISAREGIEM